MDTDLCCIEEKRIVNKDIKERTISRAETMRRLGVNRYKVQQFINAKQLQHFKIGSHYRFYPEQVEALRVLRETGSEKNNA